MILSMKIALCVCPLGMETKEILHLGSAHSLFTLWGFETACPNPPIAKSQHCSRDSSSATQQLKHGDCSSMPITIWVQVHTQLVSMSISHWLVFAWGREGSSVTIVMFYTHISTHIHVHTHRCMCWALFSTCWGWAIQLVGSSYRYPVE